MAPTKTRKAHVYVGPAGWSYDDWKGVVYPEKRPRGFHPLVYLAQFFNTVEINSSFYRIPTPQTTEKWAQLVERFGDFQFSMKLWNEFTHVRDEIDPRALREWHAAADPLRRHGRLAAVLVQFPWSFRWSQENRQYLEQLTQALAPDPLVIEVRHGDWENEAYLDWLRARGFAFANIDQPVMGNSIPPTQYVTSPIAYVRLHGRNYKNWFRDNAEAGERYDYLYTPEEIEEWMKRLQEIIKKAEKVFVIGNNHTAGRAVANGLQIKAMLEKRQVAGPPALAKAFPSIAPYVKPAGETAEEARAPEGEQMTLF